ncbi:MAG: hypothetical protein KKB25_03220, partial [Nanoarchaeota archaeon]|nr:hypothetical protein [Nanoarchaeota archaeon]
DIGEILDFEKKKYAETKAKSRKLVSSLSANQMTEEKLIELYDSHGISPDLIAEQLKIKVPENFYKKVSEKHEHKNEYGMMEKISKPTAKYFKIQPEFVAGLHETKKLYYENENLYEFTAKVLKIYNDMIILDQTAFYPRGGGAEPDLGTINGFRVYSVEKGENNVIIHYVENHNLKAGETVKGKLDRERREAIKIHHTAVHVINLAAREVLGNHIWQAGSYKDAEKARLDITHYETPSEEALAKIENAANKIVENNIPVKKEILQRDIAERKYGFRLYQGGAVPGKMLRIISVGDDHEACGGMHADSAGELGLIKILKVEKIQDGAVRLELAAGNAVEKYYRKYAEEKTRELERKGRKFVIELKENINIEDSISSGMFNKIEQEIKKIEQEVFEKEKHLRKTEEKIIKEKAEDISEKLKFEQIGSKRVLVAEVSGGPNELREISRKLSADDTVILLFSITDKINVFGSAGAKTGVNIGKIVSQACAELGGKGGGSPLLAQGIGTRKETLKEVMEKMKKMILQ